MRQHVVVQATTEACWSMCLVTFSQIYKETSRNEYLYDLRLALRVGRAFDSYLDAGITQVCR